MYWINVENGKGIFCNFRGWINFYTFFQEVLVYKKNARLFMSLEFSWFSKTVHLSSPGFCCLLKLLKNLTFPQHLCGLQSRIYWTRVALACKDFLLSWFGLTLKRMCKKSFLFEFFSPKRVWNSQLVSIKLRYQQSFINMIHLPDFFFHKCIEKKKINVTVRV